MTELIQTYLPNVYKMGWAGQAGWGTAIYLTLYMTVPSETYHQKIHSHQNNHHYYYIHYTC